MLLSGYVEGSGQGPIKGTITAFVLTEGGQTRETSVRVTNSLAQIRIRYSLVQVYTVTGTLTGSVSTNCKQSHVYWEGRKGSSEKPANTTFY